MERNVKRKVKLYLTLDSDFYTLLKGKAQADFMKVTTWTKQYLMKSLLNYNKPDFKEPFKDGNSM